MLVLSLRVRDTYMNSRTMISRSRVLTRQRQGGWLEYVMNLEGLLMRLPACQLNIPLKAFFLTTCALFDTFLSPLELSAAASRVKEMTLTFT